MEQVALTADSLSLGDLVDNRIRSRMAWSMLPVQAMYHSVLPGEYMSGQITSQVRYNSLLVCVCMCSMYFEKTLSKCTIDIVYWLS